VADACARTTEDVVFSPHCPRENTSEDPDHVDGGCVVFVRLERVPSTASQPPVIDDIFLGRRVHLPGNKRFFEWNARIRTFTRVTRVSLLMHVCYTKTRAFSRTSPEYVFEKTNIVVRPNRVYEITFVCVAAIFRRDFATLTNRPNVSYFVRDQSTDNTSSWLTRVIHRQKRICARTYRVPSFNIFFLRKYRKLETYGTYFENNI